MPDPRTLDEFNARAAQSMRMEGTGLETAQVYCCPFCAAPDWAIIKVIETDTELPKERGCSECGRTGKFIIHSDGANVSIDFVQVGGPPPPDYLGFIKRADN